LATEFEEYFDGEKEIYPIPLNSISENLEECLAEEEAGLQIYVERDAKNLERLVRQESKESLLLYSRESAVAKLLPRAEEKTSVEKEEKASDSELIRDTELSGSELITFVYENKSEQKMTFQLSVDGNRYPKVSVAPKASLFKQFLGDAKKAQAEAKLVGVEVKFMSPDTKDDSKQIECVNNAVAGGVDGIMIAANGPDAISASLKEAQAQGIKIVYVDSPANVDAEASFATNNKQGGKTAGEEMRKALEAQGVTEGTIGIISTNASTQSTVDRDSGFREAFEGSKFTIEETQYCDGDAAKAQTIAENYITKGVVGIFGANEGSTVGTGNAIKASGDSKIIGVGFDKSDNIKSLIQDGYLLCTMAQNPDVMGKMGVDALVESLNGKDLKGETVDTGVSVLNKDKLK